MTKEEAKRMGATHYFEGYCFKFDGSLWFFWNDHEWAVTYRDILSFAKPL